jgi:hypothetical protein
LGVVGEYWALVISYSPEFGKGFEAVRIRVNHRQIFSIENGELFFSQHTSLYKIHLDKKKHHLQL